MISTIKKTFKEGREYVKLGELTKADESFDMCIAQLAEATLKGSKEIEGASVSLVNHGHIDMPVYEDLITITIETDILTVDNMHFKLGIK